MKKKGQEFGLGALLSVVIIFVIAGLLAVFSLDIIEDTQDTIGAQNCPALFPTYDTSTNSCKNSSNAYTPVDSEAFNASVDTVTGVLKVPQKMPTLGNVVIAAIIIGVLLAAFGGFVAGRKI